MLASQRVRAMGLGLAAALFAFVMTPSAYGAEANTMDLFGEALLEVLDSNEDGIVSRNEAYAGGNRIISSLDQNWDGYLSWAESSTPPRRFAPDATDDERREFGRIMRLSFQHVDLDGDNWISRHEFVWWTGYVFSVADPDSDGDIDWSEVKPILQQLPEILTGDRVSAAMQKSTDPDLTQ